MKPRLQIEIDFNPLAEKIGLMSRIVLIGSCFSENISRYLSQRKLSCLSNPSGILFDPLSIERCLSGIVHKKQLDAPSLYLNNEIYSSWDHHSDFSDISAQIVLDKIHRHAIRSYDFLSSASHIMITLGSAFAYFHLENNQYVANCHRAFPSCFRKELLPVSRILDSIQACCDLVRSLCPKIKILFTISPVRHLRDGVIENNRSKARLIEAVHSLAESDPGIYYFPSYELVMDVLRDYRFFDLDLVHPNYLATDYVFQYFLDYCIREDSKELLEEFYKLHLAAKHRPRFASTRSHQTFLRTHLDRAISYSSLYPHLDFREEIEFFRAALQE